MVSLEDFAQRVIKLSLALRPKGEKLGMYKISKAMREYKPLIKWVAFKYSKCTKTAPDDLEAESILMLVKCCQRFKHGNFEHFFKRSMYNNLKKMIRRVRCKMRQGLEVDLEYAAVLPSSHVSDYAEMIQDRVDQIMPYLSKESARFLEMLINPTMEVNWQAYLQ